MTVGRWYCASTCIELSALVRRFDLFNQRCISEPYVYRRRGERGGGSIYIITRDAKECHQASLLHTERIEGRREKGGERQTEGGDCSWDSGTD